jgi:multimeric flavodoxin WrbA
MKVLAINSSLRTDGESRTELMLTHLVKGMGEAGAEVEVVNLRDKTIKYCIGCYSCSTKIPGRCVLKDDMTGGLYQKWLDADIVVYATPLFYRTVNAPLKTFIERTWPSYLPFLEQRDGETQHPPRHRQPDVVMLSVCGFPEAGEFAGLSHYVHQLFPPNAGHAAEGQSRLLAEIYRSASQALTQPLPGFETNCSDVLAATEQAGRELVTMGKVVSETMALISQPVDGDVVAQVANMFWKTCIEDGITPKVFDRRNMIPRPYLVEDLMLLLPMGFNALAAGDRRATLQFNFSGSVEGSCYFKVESGKLTAAKGEAENPDLTIDAPFQTWVDIMGGKSDPTQMIVEGTCRARGDLSLMGLFRV